MSESSLSKSPLYSHELTLSIQSKAIPYAADRLATAHQSINYGFKNLKITPSLIDTIPELSDDSSLKAFVEAINKKESSFFTVGCTSALSQVPDGYRRQGYIEFAWNCASCVQDAINYFALYFHFNKSLLIKGFNQPVDIQWVIQEAAFSDVSVHGLSCAIHIETRSLSSPEQAEQAWQLSLRMLDAYFSTVDTLEPKLIYRPLSECSRELNS